MAGSDSVVDLVLDSDDEDYDSDSIEVSEGKSRYLLNFCEIIFKLCWL